MTKEYCCLGCGAGYDSLFELRVRLVRIQDKEPMYGYFCPKCGARVA